MSFGARIALFTLGLVLFLIIFEMVRQRKFREELSIAWFLIGLGLMGSSVADWVVDPLAKLVGIAYPPALVFIWLVFFLLLAFLYFSYVISDLKGKVKELSQKIALMEYETEKGKESKDKA